MVDPHFTDEGPKREEDQELAQGPIISTGKDVKLCDSDVLYYILCVIH